MQLQHELVELKAALAAMQAKEAEAAANAAKVAAPAASSEPVAHLPTEPAVSNEFVAGSPAADGDDTDFVYCDNEERLDYNEWSPQRHRAILAPSPPGAPRRLPNAISLRGPVLPPPRRLQFEPPEEPAAKRRCSAGVEIKCDCGRTFCVA